MYMKNPVNDVNTSYFSEAELRVVKLLASGSQAMYLTPHC